MMTERPEFLFVYGTLLTEAAHPMGALLARHSERRGAGSIRARLYIITETDDQGQNSYPGAVPSAHCDDIVHGDVHRITDPGAVFDAFDEYEACTDNWPKPYEFLLRPVEVTLEGGATLWAGAYLYTWDVSRAVPVPSGRFAGDARGVR